MTRRKGTWSAVVVAEDAAWFAGVRRRPERVNTPSWVFSRPVSSLIEHAHERWFGDSDGVVVWQPVTPRTPPMTPAILDEMRKQGWRVSNTGLDTGSYSVWPTPDGPAVHFVVANAVHPDRFPFTLGSDNQSRLALELARYHELTGVVWRGSAGMTGIAGIRDTHTLPGKGNQPLWRWHDAGRTDGVGAAYELRANWARRDMTPAERECRYVHHFDVRSMYLASALNANIGWDAPEACGAEAFDPAYSGYWLVRSDQLGDVEKFAPMPSTLVRPAPNTTWLTTPVMAYLYEMGRRVEVLDAVIAKRSGRHLRKWAENLRDALQANYDREFLSLDLSDALKDTYTRTIGLLKRETARIYRPDWRDEVVDRARVNLLRKVVLSGYEPLRYQVDGIWIATDDDADTACKNLRVKHHIGSLRLEETMTPADYVALYERRKVSAR